MRSHTAPFSMRVVDPPPETSEFECPPPKPIDPSELSVVLANLYLRHRRD